MHPVLKLSYLDGMLLYDNICDTYNLCLMHLICLVRNVVEIVLGVILCIAMSLTLLECILYVARSGDFCM